MGVGVWVGGWVGVGVGGWVGGWVSVVVESLVGLICFLLLFCLCFYARGHDWKFGTGTRNVDRNGPHGFVSSSREMPPDDTKSHDAEAKRKQGPLLLPLICL